MIFLIDTLILSGAQVFLGLLGMIALFWLGIGGFKLYWQTKSTEIRGEHRSDSGLPTVRKYREVAIQPYSNSIRLIATTMSLLIITMMLAWTTWKDPVLIPAIPISGLDDVDESFMTTVPLPPPIAENHIPKDATVDESIPLHIIEQPKLEEKELPIESDIFEEEYDVTDEEMEQTLPRFPGCEDIEGTVDEKKSCADQKMLKFIYDSIEYPPMGRGVHIEGMAVVSFVVHENGTIGDAKILRDPGGGCGKEALRIVESMNELPQRWIPGTRGGEPVRMRYNIPVRFRLN